MRSMRPAPPKSLLQHHLRLCCCASASSDSEHVLCTLYALGFVRRCGPSKRCMRTQTRTRLPSRAVQRSHSSALQRTSTGGDLVKGANGVLTVNLRNVVLVELLACYRHSQREAVTGGEPARRTGTIGALFDWQHAHFASYACTHTEHSADAAVEFIAVLPCRAAVPPTTYPPSW